MCFCDHADRDIFQLDDRNVKTLHEIETFRLMTDAFDSLIHQERRSFIIILKDLFVWYPLSFQTADSLARCTAII